MPTKKFDPNVLADKAFQRMFNVESAEADDTKISGTNTSSIADQMVHTPPTDFRNSGRKKGIEHVGQKFYITKEQWSALRRRAYLDDCLDLSGHVRAALELYLIEDLKVIRSGGK